MKPANKLTPSFHNFEYNRHRGEINFCAISHIAMKKSKKKARGSKLKISFVRMTEKNLN